MNKSLLITLLLLLVSPKNNVAERNPFVMQNKHSSLALQSWVTPIHYAKATQLAAFITHAHRGLLSPGGHAQADPRTNQLWLQDDKHHLNAIRRLIHQLDAPVSQVLIKARIVTVEANFMHSLGVMFSAGRGTSKSNHTGTFDIPIANLGNGHQLDLELSALEQNGHAHVISSPELMASNRQTAIIESGEEVPYQEKTGQGNTSVAFKKATLRLKVTPIILPNQRILLHLSVNQDKMSGLLLNGVPAIRTQQLSTQVLVDNKETVVLGGIVEYTRSHQETGVPLLRKIPIIGALFRHRRQLKERRQLLIFVTPQVLRIHEKRQVK